MSRRDRMSGNEAVAEAMRQINPDVMGAFPITPSTEIPQYYSKFIADGKVIQSLLLLNLSIAQCLYALVHQLQVQEL